MGRSQVKKNSLVYMRGELEIDDKGICPTCGHSSNRTPVFNMSKRKLCGKCGFPEAFCVHTIENEYKKWCPEKPHIWQLTRSYAMEKTFAMRIQKANNSEIDSLRRDNNTMRKRLEDFEGFMNVLQTQGILLAKDVKQKGANE